MLLSRSHLPLILVLLIQPALLRSETPAIDAAKLEAIKPRMQQFVDDSKAAGIVTLVRHQGEVVHHEAVGFAELDPKRAMGKDSLFWIASMTKPITGAAVMILVDEGKLSLDDEVSKYIPAFKDVKLEGGAAPAKLITIRHLVTHTSGIGEARAAQSVEGATIASISEAIAKQPMNFEPGTKWQYGSGLTVAGRVVEVASGMAYEEFLQKRIFEPLKMKDTTFHLNDEQRKRVARTYKPGEGGKGLAPVDNPYLAPDMPKKKTPNPSGGLFSTADDMGRFYQMVLNGGKLDGARILSKKAVEQILAIHSGDVETGFTPGNGWGVGCCVVRQPQGVTAMLSPGSAGHGGAHGTQSWCDPKRQMVFIMLVQRTGFGNGDASDIRGVFQQLAVDAVK